jgi:hypothetical protein
MSLFTKKVINEFRTKTKPLRRVIRKTMVEGREHIKIREYKIMNRKELIEHIKGPGTTPGTRQGSLASAPPNVSSYDIELKRKRAEDRALDYDKKTQDVLDQLMDMNSRMCEKQVNTHYTIGSTHNAISTYNFDIIAIIDTDPNVSIYDRDKSKQINEVVGFLIAQKGECPKYPDAYVINLICTRVTGISKLLLGCYLFAIKCAESKGIMQRGILELAGAFSNIDGYCAYGGLGFAIDPDIFTVEPKTVIDTTTLVDTATPCLQYSNDMLPMPVDLSEYNDKDDIIETLKSGAGAKKFGTKSICQRDSTHEQKTELKKLNRFFYIACMISHEKFRKNGWLLSRIPGDYMLELAEKMIEISKKKNEPELKEISAGIKKLVHACNTIKTTRFALIQNAYLKTIDRIYSTKLQKYNLNLMKNTLLIEMEETVASTPPVSSAAPTPTPTPAPGPPPDAMDVDPIHSSGILGNIYSATKRATKRIKRKATSLISGISSRIRRMSATSTASSSNPRSTKKRKM